MGCGSSSQKSTSHDFYCEPDVIRAAWVKVSGKHPVTCNLADVLEHFLKGGDAAESGIAGKVEEEEQHARMLLRSHAAMDAVLMLLGRHQLMHLFHNTEEPFPSRAGTPDGDLDLALIRLLLRCAHLEGGAAILASHRFAYVDIILLAIQRAGHASDGEDVFIAETRELLAILTRHDNAFKNAFEVAFLALCLWTCMKDSEVTDDKLVHVATTTASSMRAFEVMGLAPVALGLIHDLLQRSGAGTIQGNARPYELGKGALQRAYSAHCRVLVRATMCAWQLTPCDEFPTQMKRRTKKEQRDIFRRCKRLLLKSKTLEHKFRATYGAEEGPRWKEPGAQDLLENIRATNREGAALVHNSDQDEDIFNTLRDRHLFRATRAFCSRAEQCGLPKAEIFQAGRNAWTCFAFQVIYGSSNALCQDAVFGYSMLYPYTDNFLDDTGVSMEHKLQFQSAFDKRLQGSLLAGSSLGNLFDLHPRLRKAFEMVTMIERQWDRERYADAFLSLAAINDAQTWSLAQDLKGESSDYLSHQRLLEQTAYKGGSSVLADAHMVYGKLSVAQAAFAFALGMALQVVDDLQDSAADIESEQHTMFTMADSKRCERYGRQGAIKLCQFLSQVCMNAPSHTSEECTIDTRLRKLMLHMTWNMVFKAVARNPRLFDATGFCGWTSLRFVSKWGALGPLPAERMHQIASMKTLHRMACQNVI
eukprot:g1705.t1